MTTIAIQNATADTVYQAALQVYERLRGHPFFVTSYDTMVMPGAAYANLGTHLAVARGDTMFGGTPVSDATRAAVLDQNGAIRPEVRSSIAGWTAILNAAFPLAAAAVPPVVVITPGGAIIQQPQQQPQAAGVLDGELFGINKKLLLVAGVAAYFLFSEK